MSPTPEMLDWEELPTAETISKTSAQILTSLLLRVTREKYEVIRDDLAPEQIEALWEDALASESMIPDKIQVIGYMLSVAQIKKITPQKLAKMSENKLRKIIEAL